MGLVGSSGEDVPFSLPPVFDADPAVKPRPDPAPVRVLSDLEVPEARFDEVLPKEIVRGRECPSSPLFSRKLELLEPLELCVLEENANGGRVFGLTWVVAP